MGIKKQAEAEMGQAQIKVELVSFSCLMWIESVDLQIIIQIKEYYKNR